MKNLWLALALLIGVASSLFGNGGAWQTGVRETGNVSASDKDRHTEVTIENEMLKIDLHREHAGVEVRYRMHNSGPKVQQDFFFPVERWGKGENSDAEITASNIEHYRISVDGKQLKATDVAGPKEESTETQEGTSGANQESSETKKEDSQAAEENSEVEDEGGEADEEDDDSTSGPLYQEELSTIRSWKKSVIPFEKNQTREVTIHYDARYEERDESVSDDSHNSNATFAYSLSPAATWKGPIGKGKIEINILHPEPEDVSIAKPNDRFKKISDTRYEWDFENLKPTLADDIRIVAHSKYDSYPTGYSEEDIERRASYIIRGNQYFLKGRSGEWSPWAEGAKDDGIGESITLNVKRPLPLYAIMIRPGYWDYPDEAPWKKNNRVAALEITLNDEQTFTETIPDEIFHDPYLIRVRDYTKPVNKIKMVIKGVHRGTQFRDTCISLVELRAPLSKKPEVRAAR
jgi:hypothetical protein